MSLRVPRVLEDTFNVKFVRTRFGEGSDVYKAEAET
jgi:hypothetical protein